MMERFGMGDRVSDEGSLERGPGECKWPVEESWAESRPGGELGEGENGTASELALLTGLREKRDFLGIF
jgi:hypothetical protein